MVEKSIYLSLMEEMVLYNHKKDLRSAFMYFLLWQMQEQGFWYGNGHVPTFDEIYDIAEEVLDYPLPKPDDTEKVWQMLFSFAKAEGMDESNMML